VTYEELRAACREYDHLNGDDCLFETRRRNYFDDHDGPEERFADTWDGPYNYPGRGPVYE
jgi:hypothetical protein